MMGIHLLLFMHLSTGLWRLFAWLMFQWIDHSSLVFTMLYSVRALWRLFRCMDLGFLFSSCGLLQSSFIYQFSYKLWWFCNHMFSCIGHTLLCYENAHHITWFRCSFMRSGWFLHQVHEAKCVFYLLCMEHSGSCHQGGCWCVSTFLPFVFFLSIIIKGEC